jgi:hypothetical protein
MDHHIVHGQRMDGYCAECEEHREKSDWNMKLTVQLVVNEGLGLELLTEQADQRTLHQTLLHGYPPERCLECDMFSRSTAVDILSGNS